MDHETPPQSHPSTLDAPLTGELGSLPSTMRARARGLVLTSSVLALCGLAVVIGSLVRGTTDVGVAPVTALLFALVPVVFRLSRSYSAAAWSFVALAMMLAVTFIPTHGGLLSVHALWLPLLPAVVLVVLDYRAAVASVFFVFGFGFVLVAGHTRGLVPAPLSEPTPVDVAVVVLCSSLVFLAVSHTREVAVGDLLEDRVSEARARARAEAASRAKSSILASVSHELRTPMTGILGLADLLSETSLDRKQSDWVRTIHKTGHALLALLDDLLDTARLDSGNLTLKQRPFRPLELAEQVVALFRPRARGKRIALHLEVAPDVAVKVLGDAARIRQVLINLVGNAVKFTHQGGIVLRVQQDDHVLVFEVTDSGVGIPRDRLEDVFTPFVRAEADHASAAGGVGLGLSIARLLVEAMDGEISVRSEEQVGTTFQVRLPLEVLDADAPTTETSSYRPRPDASLRVLVAEDNPVNRMVITAMLESMGHEVRVAHNGDEVVPTARAFHPDVCLMDMRMPVVDGLEATRRLRADARFDRVRVIALTANAFDEDREACLTAGMDDFLTKPVTREQLRVAIEGSARLVANA